MRRRTEYDFPRRLETQQLGQRAYGAPSRIAAECDTPARDRAEATAEREDIDQSLGRMLVPAVAGVDHGLLGFRGHALCRALFVMTDNEGIAQARADGGA